MKYSLKQYAAAFLLALKGAEVKKQPVVMKRFLAVLKKNGDFTHRTRIVKEIQRQHGKASGRRRVELCSASKVSQDVHTQLHKVFGGNAVISEKIDPALLAGITFLIDDEILIDASARSRIRALFQGA